MQQYTIFKLLEKETFSVVLTLHPFHSVFPRERPPPHNAVAYVSVSTQTASDGQAARVWDELSLVGLPDAIDVQALFGPTGMSRLLS